MNAPLAPMAAQVRAVDLDQSDESARIEGFVAEQGGSLFQRPAWLLAVERGTGNRARGLVAERGGQLTGWLPFSHVRSPFFGSALVSSGFGVGGGVLAERAGDRLALFRAAEELAQRLSVGTIDLRDAAAPDDWDTLTGGHSYFAGDLAPDDEAQLLAIPRKARAEVRKGLKVDLDLAIGTSEADRAAHYAVYSESVRNLGTPVFPRPLFDAMLDLFGEDAEIMTAFHRGQPVSSVLTLYHDGAALPYWGGGVFQARALHATERLYYGLMCRARERGCTRFDFGRSKTGSGPYHFKRNWGFVPEPLTYRSWAAPGMPRRDIDPTASGRSRAVDLWKRLPLRVATAIGPFIARGLG